MFEDSEWPHDVGFGLWLQPRLCIIANMRHCLLANISISQYLAPVHMNGVVMHSNARGNLVSDGTVRTYSEVVWVC
jgi:hypothetical protein